MNAIFEPKLEISVPGTRPDVFDETSGRIPPHEFVVTRRRDGSVASLFGDLVWDFSAYTPDGSAKRLFFSYWGAEQISPAREERSVEIRTIMFCLIWRRHGASLSLGTLANYNTVLCACAQYAEYKEIRLAELLSSAAAVLDFVKTRASGWMSETLGSLLTLLVRVGDAQLGFSIVSDKCIQEVKQHNKAYRASLKQHPPLPTRVYSQLLTGLVRELTSWLCVADEMLDLFRRCGADPRLGRLTERSRKAIKGSGQGNGDTAEFIAIASPACISYLRERNKALNVKSLSNVIGDIQNIAKLTVQAFTGMRDDEAASLPYLCVETSVSSVRTHYFVIGRTTKLNKGLAKRTRWVTNEDAVRAIRAAQNIADSVYSVFNVHPAVLPSVKAGYPLFVSLRYMRMSGVPLAPEADRFLAGQLQHRELPEACLAVISDDDLRELEHIDPHRAWRSEEQFQVGRPWLFTTHQLRRSLALYAQRSGLVSLPSLRRQLQHLTEEMSRYYARGSAFANDFIGTDKDHFGREWQMAQPESAALSYVLNVLLTDDVLFGGHASWVERRLKGPEGAILVDRAVTLKRFKKGEIAYRETIMGGCTNVGQCDKVAVRWLHVDCIRDNCKNLVCSVPKLERVISAQSRLVQSLDNTTIEFRTEQEDLNVLIGALAEVTDRTTKGKDE